MKALIYLFVFIFGLIVGSFLNCIIYRLSKKESFLVKRSYCPYCKHTLHWQDLIPLLSFLVLKGRCRYCKKPISLQYPLVELATGFLFLLVVSQNIDSLFFELLNCEAITRSGATGFLIFSFLNILFLFLVSCFLIIIFVYDLKHYVVPDRVIYPAIFIAGSWYLVVSIFFNHYLRYEILNIMYSAVLAAVFFLAIVLISGGKGMGIGDVKLAFFMGLLLGYPNILVALSSSFFLGVIIGIMLIISGKRSLKSEVPFAPFLVTGTFLAMFFGEKIIDFSLRLFVV